METKYEENKMLKVLLVFRRGWRLSWRNVENSEPSQTSEHVDTVLVILSNFIKGLSE